jgi:signal transduction histidine kinase
MGEGAGLGLYIVKRICERYGWGIEVESNEHQGTRVRITFDADLPKLQEAEIEESRGRPHTNSERTV